MPGMGQPGMGMPGQPGMPNGMNMGGMPNQFGGMPGQF